MFKVTFLLSPHIMASSICLPLEMLNAADNIRRTLDRHCPRLSIQLVSLDKQAIASSSGLLLSPNTLIDAVEPSDLLIIPGLWRNPFISLKQQAYWLDWLKSHSQQHKNICAVGTGSSFLAKAGLLDHKPATTHWFYFDAMEKAFPNVQWKRQHLITQAGHIYCAGSINSVADLTIHFIEQSFSQTIARRVESQFSPEIRRAYNQHLFDEHNANLHNDELVAEIQYFIRQHANETINFTDLASQYAMTSRTLQRRFNKATGFSPLKYQQLLRINNARELLQNSNLSIQEVSEMVGYVDAAYFASLFKRNVEQNPHSWRKAVRGKLFHVSGKDEDH